MVEEKYIQLIHQEIDGQNSADESKDLQSYLLKNEEASKLYSELNGISHILEKVEVKEPSQNLKKNILNAIQPYGYPTQETSASPGFLQNIKSIFSIKYGFSFAAGLVAGLILFAIVGNQDFQAPANEISNFYGTMIPKEAGKSMQPASFFEINLDAVNGSVNVKKNNEVVLVELKLTPSHIIDATLHFDETKLGFDGIAKENDFPEGSIEYSVNQIKIRSNSKNDYLIFFKRLDLEANINVKITQNGTLLLAEVLSISN